MSIIFSGRPDRYQRALLSSLRRTASLVSSRNASAAIQRADRDPCSLMRLAASIASELRPRLRFPICRNAQFTAFLTKLRSSSACFSSSGRNAANLSSPAFLSWTVSHAIRTMPARYINSSSRSLHSATFVYASGVRQNRCPQVPSTIAQLSKSPAQVSICTSVTCFGSSIRYATARAS